MGFGTEEVTEQLKSHRMISPRQYVIAALAALTSAGLWWLATRRSSIFFETLAFGLLLPLGAHRDRERTGLRILGAFVIGAVLTAGDLYARRRGWVR